MSDHQNGERRINLHVPVLTRVEGEGSLRLVIEGDRIQHLRLSIFEPPRLFEKFLEGRSFEELPDLVSRICGICPVAYQMSAVEAVEGLFAARPGNWVRDMRRLMYCGEWIESHCLHIHLLAAPDFFGYQDAMTMARDHPDIIRRGMRLQGLGNALIKLLGGRSVHPVGVRVGGFHRAPPPDQVESLLRQLRAALPEAEALLQWALTITMPERSQAFPSMACVDAEGYPIFGEQLQVSNGTRFSRAVFEDHVSEHQEPDSTALFSLLDGQSYLVGPLARFNLAGDRLPSRILGQLQQAGIAPGSGNPFHSLAVRAAEVLYAFEEAIRLLENYYRPARTWEPVRVVEGVAFGATEAPRGTLWHRYEIDAEGKIRKARIVPPTSQNQARIESDLRQSLQAFGLARKDEELRLHCEQVIRNYDPCISCATHFLQLSTERL